MAKNTGNLEEVIEGEVVKLVTSEGHLTTELTQIESELQQEPKFKAFLQKQAELREAQAKSAAAWKSVESQMIEHGIKSIKGEWGSITIVEKKNFKAADLSAVPSKFIKKALDTTKVSSSYTLENKLPKGVEMSTTQYLTKRIK